MKKLLTMLSVLTTTSIIMPLTVSYTVKANRYNQKPGSKPSNGKTDADKINHAVEALSKIENEKVGISSPEIGLGLIDHTTAMDVKNVVKIIPKYKDTINEVNVKEELILEKIDGTVLKPNNSVAFGDILNVKGVVQSGDAKKTLNLLLRWRKKSQISKY